MKRRAKRANLSDLILKERVRRAVNGGMSARPFHLSRGGRLFILWLTPGAPPPGPFG
jgi:hypothetical protein